MRSYLTTLKSRTAARIATIVFGAATVCLVLTVLNSPSISQEDAERRAIAQDPAQLEIPQIMISVTEVVTDPEEKVELKTGDTDALHKQIAELVEAGNAKVLERFKFVTLNDQEGTTQAGASQPIAGGGSPKGRSYSCQEVGTIVSCVPRAIGNQVILDFLYEKSELIGGDDDAPAATVKTKFEGIVRIAKGQSIVIHGQRLGPDEKPIEWNIIISASVMAD